MRRITKRSFLGFTSNSVREVFRRLEAKHQQERSKLEEELHRLIKENDDLKADLKQHLPD